MTPQARQDRLVVQQAGDETIIYDEQRDHVHRLNRSASVIWSHCNGQRTVSGLAEILRDELAAPVTEDMVWLALDRLEKEYLLQSPLVRPGDAVRITRRQVLQKAALIGGATLLIPVIQSVVAPTPAMAMSIGCASRGEVFSPTRPCCGGLRQGRTRCLGRTDVA